MCYSKCSLEQCMTIGKISLHCIHKRSKKDDITLLLRKLKVNNYEVSWCSARWKVDLESAYKYIENKNRKNICLLYKATPFLNEESLLSLYYSYIHSCINYANVTQRSSYMTNLKKLCSQQKHVIRLICSKLNFEHAKQLFQSNKILNTYKVNILNVAAFIFKFNQKNVPISANWTTYNQSTILKQANTQFQLKYHISGKAFS